ncbi:MAG TPA: hypothetical protein VKV95_22645 [Terriglobia bacterium]|nr:hypothetical protein [Terriglobia bacterium]
MRQIRISVKVGFGLAVVAFSIGLLIHSDALFVYLAPGIYIYAWLFGSPLDGPFAGLWIILGTAMTTVIFGTVIFTAQLLTVAWRRRT